MFGSSDYAGTKIDLMKHGQREMKKRIFFWLCCPPYRLSFAWNCGWLTFKERDKFNLQRVVGKQQNWQSIFQKKKSLPLFLWVYLSRDYPKIRGSLLAWLLAFTKSFAWLVSRVLELIQLRYRQATIMTS